VQICRIVHRNHGLGVRGGGGTGYQGCRESRILHPWVVYPLRVKAGFVIRGVRKFFTQKLWLLFSKIGEEPVEITE
jgi:hypothetical protein